jgi:hypothetical protein
MIFPASLDTPDRRILKAVCPDAIIRDAWDTITPQGPQLNLAQQLFPRTPGPQRQQNNNMMGASQLVLGLVRFFKLELRPKIPSEARALPLLKVKHVCIPHS